MELCELRAGEAPHGAVPDGVGVNAAKRDRRFRRMLAIARHSEIDGDALLEQLEREDAADRLRARS
jgi:hypothetical protein